MRARIIELGVVDSSVVRDCNGVRIVLLEARGVFVGRNGAPDLCEAMLGAREGGRREARTGGRVDDPEALLVVFALLWMEGAAINFVGGERLDADGFDVDAKEGVVKLGFLEEDGGEGSALFEIGGLENSAEGVRTGEGGGRGKGAGIGKSTEAGRGSLVPGGLEVARGTCGGARRDVVVAPI